MADHVDRVSLEIADEIGIQIVGYVYLLCLSIVALNLDGPSNDSGSPTVSPYI